MKYALASGLTYQGYLSIVPKHMQHNLAKNSIFSQLAKYISLVKPLTDVSNILSSELVVFMDQRKFVGIASWKKWIYELHRIVAKKNQKLGIDFEELSQEADIYTITGRWVISGKQHSQRGIVKYQVKDGKICKIWTTKKNYIPIFGATIVSPIYFHIVCCKIFFRNLIFK